MQAVISSTHHLQLNLLSLQHEVLCAQTTAPVKQRVWSGQGPCLRYLSQSKHIPIVASQCGQHIVNGPQIHGHDSESGRCERHRHQPLQQPARQHTGGDTTGGARPRWHTAAPCSSGRVAPARNKSIRMGLRACYLSCSSCRSDQAGCQAGGSRQRACSSACERTEHTRPHRPPWTRLSSQDVWWPSSDCAHDDCCS